MANTPVKPRAGAEPDSIVEGLVTTPEVAGAVCMLERPSDPCAIVILGASGDLATRKLIPALYNLYIKGGMPDHFLIMGCGRTEMTSPGFRNRLRTEVRGSGSEMRRWKEFAGRLHYHRLHYDSEESFRRLGSALSGLERKSNTGGNRLFYLALPMFLYESIARLLGSSGLAGAGSGEAWSRIVVEKPYGSDRRSAAELDKVLSHQFSMEQIFRIDHYLAKETVQNLLMFRFANSIFEPLWNRNYIEHVDIITAEALGVESRAGYYENAGVLRDMFQNHMMQLVALTAMEPPNRFETEAVHDEKVKVFRALRPFPVGSLFENLVLGQYGPGAIDGAPVRGYRQEEGVAPDSLTPTFGMMRLFIDNWRWQGVPFFLTSGKRLADKLTQIVIRFRPVPFSMFRDLLGDTITSNALTLCIQPREHITLQFQTKSPGAKVCLRSVNMDFSYLQGYSGPVLEAYEKALLDCMQGDQMLFWRQEGIDLTWAFMEPILKACEACREKDRRLAFYPAGSWGPVEAAELKERMEKEGTGI